MRRTRTDFIGNEEEDDLYSGFNDFNSTLNTDGLEFDESFQNSAKNVANRRPMLVSSRGRTATGNRLGTSAGFSGDSIGFVPQPGRTAIGTARPITGIGGESGGLNRPMTAVRGAGYTGVKSQRGFDPLNQKNPIPSIELRNDDSPESKIKQIEDKIGVLIEDSVMANCSGNFQKALVHAKDAQQKERLLMKLREQASLVEGHDWDITFSVLFNLASQYEACEMFTEALSTYQSITKNKFLVHGTKVKINMGNIYLKQNLPTKAIKMYRMAMDQLANTNRSLRLKLMHNMGIVFLRINHPDDAAASFEYIMSEKPSFKTGLHLVVANFMAGDAAKTRHSFQELLHVPLETEDEEKYTTISDDPVSQLLVEALKTDRLRKLEKERKTYGERCILSAARLIAPFVQNTFTEGHNWVTEAIKSSRHASLAHALEISKALVFLKQRELGEAIEILKSFEKKETKVATAAATNLSFLLYLQGDLEQAEKYGEAGKLADFYNSSALVNLGNCMASRGDSERAKQLYQEAISMDSSCVEALYNLGLMNQRLRFYEEALEYFHKVLLLVRNHSQVLYQIGRTHELMGNTEIGMEWYLKALALSPTDSGILNKMAQLYERDGDRRQAYQYYYDSYKCNPANIEVIDWIGSYMLSDINVPERAIIFFKQAYDLQPNDPKWLNSIGSCYRKVGNINAAIEIYKKSFKQFPDNVQSLQQLIRLLKESGNSELKFYIEEMKKLEKASAKQKTKQQQRYVSAANERNPPYNTSSSSLSKSKLSSDSNFGRGQRNVPSRDGISLSSGKSGIMLHGQSGSARNTLKSSDGFGSAQSKHSSRKEMLESAQGRKSNIGRRDSSSLTASTSSSRSTSGFRRLVPERYSDQDEEVDDVDAFFANQTVSSNLLKFSH